MKHDKIEWIDHPDGGAHGYGSTKRSYSITRKTTEGVDSFIVKLFHPKEDIDGQRLGPGYATLEQARAAAEADYAEYNGEGYE
jgi:hypothetical protein